MKKQNLFLENYKILNEKQKEAVDTIYGPIMVVAGPGTGKTQIIAIRTANILDKTDTNPENIFITTFTEAGVIAIRERLIKFIGNEAYKVNISTIHSFATEVIKTFPEKFIEYKASQAIDEVESLEILKKITDKLLENKQIEVLTSDYDTYYYLRTIKSKISNLKSEGTSLEAFKIAIKKQKNDFEEELSEIKPTLKKYEKTKEKHEKEIKKLEELLLFFKEYNDYLREKGFYDFDDMINFVLEKFKTDEDLVFHYAEKFQFIMLDEYQDTNNAQNQIINLITFSQKNIFEKEKENNNSKEKKSILIPERGGVEEAETGQLNIMVVGDDDQSIYRFQGANIENMLEFSTNYKDTKFIVLENNYRSAPEILQTAERLIKNNSERLSNKIKTINKNLKASGRLKNCKEKIKVFKAPNEIQEQSFIVNKIKNLIQNGKEKKDIAIIVRNNSEVEFWTNLLLQNEIEADSKLKTNILNSVYVNYILTFLKVINNPWESEKNFIDLILSDISGLDKISIFKINRELYIKNYSKKWKETFIDFLGKIEQTSSLGEEKIIFERENEVKNLIEFKNKIIEFQAKSKEISIKEFFSLFINEFGILEYIEKNGDFYDLEDIYTFFNKINSFIENDKNLTIERLLEKINLYKNYNYSINRQILKENKSGVQVLTAHSSKGLEFNSVFIPGLFTGNWEGKKVRDLIKLPIYISGEGIQNTNFEQIEEDRRLFFVAITRAMKNLFLSYPAGKGIKPLLESVFLQEISEILEEIENNEEVLQIKEIVENSIKNNLIKYDNLDLEYIGEFLETYKLSPSDLNAFLEDPMIFLNRVIFKYPFEDNKYTIFGKIYHRTLELFYLKFKKEGKIPEKSYLTSTFKYLLDREAITPEEYENMLEKGISGLEGYYDLYSAKKEAPLVLEYSFKRKNIFFEGIPLTGTIDKIEKSKLKVESPSGKLNDVLQEGQMALFREKVDLIDYKTGKAKSVGIIKGVDKFGNKKEGKGIGNYFRQLLFYRLLCESDRKFGAKFEVGNLALDFVEGKDGNYKYVEVEYSFEEYEYFKKELIGAREQIKSLDFWKEILGR